MRESRGPNQKMRGGSNKYMGLQVSYKRTECKKWYYHHS